jgi:hypothetical protein
MAPLRCMALLAATLMLAACGAPEEVAGEALTADARTERGAFTVAVTEPEGGFQRGSNSFTVRATDAQGRPAALRTARARMPAHAHEDAVATVLPAGDGWRVEGLVLDMAGRWELSLGFALEGAEDSALIVLRIP